MKSSKQLLVGTFTNFSNILVVLKSQSILQQIKMKNICKLNPITGESSFITPKQHEEVKQHRSKLQKKVIMCSSCRCIVHSSAYLIRKLDQKYYERSIQEVLSLKNHRTKIQGNQVCFSCNNCGQKIGLINEKRGFIQLDSQNSRVVCSQLVECEVKRKERQICDQQINIGCYNGLKINSLKKLLCKLMYSKCSRYQNNLTDMKGQIQSYLTALNNFIRVIDAFNSGDESFSKKVIIQQLKASSYSSFLFNGKSKDEQRFSHSHRKIEHEQTKCQYKQQMKLCSLSTTSIQQNTSQNLRSRVTRHLSPIKQSMQ